MKTSLSPNLATHTQCSLSSRYKNSPKIRFVDLMKPQGSVPLLYFTGNKSFCVQVTPEALLMSITDVRNVC